VLGRREGSNTEERRRANGEKSRREERERERERERKRKREKEEERERGRERKREKRRAGDIRPHNSLLNIANCNTDPLNLSGCYLLARK